LPKEGQDYLKEIRFNLQFPIADTATWAKLYPEHWDDHALEAGARIKDGEFTQENLETIVEWKSHRRLKLIKLNSVTEIAEALKVAVTASEPRTAIGVLMGLRGVAVPMASAIVTAIMQ
jgi:hypothetical protein